MSGTVIAGSLLGAAIGTAAAYGATQKEWHKRVHFVQRNNLESEIEDLDIEIKEGETCTECGASIEPEEIGLVYREDGEYKTVCNREECLDTYDLD